MVFSGWWRAGISPAHACILQRETGSVTVRFQMSFQQINFVSNDFINNKQ